MNTAWLVIADSENRVSVGNEGYDDDPSSHYSWNDTVPHCNDIAVGDILVLRSKRSLLGVGVLEKIRSGSGTFNRNRCPFCNSTNVRERTTISPRFKCGNQQCKREFQDTEAESVSVQDFVGYYGSSWVDLFDEINVQAVKKCCFNPDTQHAMTPIRWNEFLRNLPDRYKKIVSVFTGIHPPGTGAPSKQPHGHTTRTVRARLGQQSFRAKMLKQFKSTCAFSGRGPEQALDAAHLYSYAEEEFHHPHGGILLRKDLHRLFDIGAICINPESERVDVHPDLQEFSDYAALHDTKVHVRLPKAANVWLKLHWDQWRSAVQ